MKLTTSTLAILAGTLVCLVGFIVVLVAMGKDPSQIVTFLGTIVIPSAVGLVAAQKADGAKTAAAQAVSNTNGRMTELIASNARLAELVAMMTPPETATNDGEHEATP